MEDAKQLVQQLIEEGRTFSFHNFSQKSVNGYPNAFKPDWVRWVTRVNGAVDALCGKDSAPARMVGAANCVSVLGNGDDKFENAKGHYLGALETVHGILEKDTFGELLKSDRAIAGQDLSNRVFVVHGRDDLAKNELERLLREMGLDPVVLHRQPDGGKTVIEKFEQHADVGFAFILLTPDEYAYLAEEHEKPSHERTVEARARPNVIFEFGYFIGRLGRERTCCLYRGDVQLPSDLSGIIYKRFERSPEEAAWSISGSLRPLGTSSHSACAVPARCPCCGKAAEILPRTRTGNLGRPCRGSIRMSPPVLDTMRGASLRGLPRCWR
jgi:predicted nucleotide-binding protein